MFTANPALVLNADFQPLSYFPLSIFGWERGGQEISRRRRGIRAGRPRIRWKRIGRRAHCGSGPPLSATLESQPDRRAGTASNTDGTARCAAQVRGSPPNQTLLRHELN